MSGFKQMKTRLILLTIVAVLVLLFPLVSLVQYNMGNHVMVNGMTVSGSTVLLVSIVFSTFSWFLFAWASKSIKVEGISLSIISGAVLMIPFYDVLGPMTSVIVGLVAGFAAFMFQKYLTARDKKSLIISIVTITVSYLVLITMIILASNTLHLWDVGDGIGEWTGTAEGMERHVQIVGPSFIVDNIFTENPNECWYQDNDGTMVPCLVHSDTLNLDPDLSPSYVMDFALSPIFNSLFAIIGIIISSFVVTYLLVKWQKKPTRPYLALVLVAWLLDFGIRNFYLSHPYLPQVIDVTPEKGLNLIGHLTFSFWLPIIAVIIAGILIYRSSVIRKLIKK